MENSSQFCTSCLPESPRRNNSSRGLTALLVGIAAGFAFLLGVFHLLGK